MAIDNLHSRCIEVNNAIKQPKKAEKRTDKKEKAETEKKADKDEKKDSGGGNDEFSMLLNVPYACKKLTVVMDNMVDFREIINSQDKMTKEKRRGFVNHK